MSRTITFHTNLDEAQPFLFSNHHRGNIGRTWTEPPAVGSRIEFSMEQHTGIRGSTFDLVVVGVTYSADGQDVRVELHIPKHHESIATWTEWFRRRLGKV